MAAHANRFDPKMESILPESFTRKPYNAEQIVTLLRQIEVLMAQGKSALEACREAGISQQNYATSCSTAKSSTA